MGLDSIWDERGEYLTKKSKGFHARSTGCGCCSYDLDTEEEVKREAINSLKYILLAVMYFKWDIKSLVVAAKKQIKEDRKK